MATHEETTTRRLTRRRLLLAGATATAAGLAGCAGTGGDGTTTAEPTTTGGTTDAETPTQRDRSAPVDPVPEDSRCAVCNMVPAEFPAWNAQLTHENGDRKYFCSPGCLTAYHAVPSHFDDAHTRADVAFAWARDYDSKAYVDATTAHYVLEETGAHIDAPMGDNPVPFADRAAAAAYVDRYDSLTGDDIVTLSAFDVALARRFRASFLPEE